MKVGILTFHNAYNYGAVLQAYATQTFIKGLGHDAEIIDYHNTAVDETYRRQEFYLASMPKRAFWKIPDYIFSKILYFIKRKRFAHFRHKYLSLRKPCYNRYDVILVGSDQLWNVNITDGFDDIYWGSFPVQYNGVLLSWSISLNMTTLSTGERAYISDHIQNFSAISVREKQSAELLSPLYPKEITLLPDPVFLLTEEQWSLLCENGHSKKKYVLAYILRVGNEKHVLSIANRIAQQKGLEIIVIDTYSEFYSQKGRKETVGPLGFLSHIKNAEYVVTNSFHACAFSIIFRKPFNTVETDKTYNIRIHSLLQRLNCEDCIIDASAFDMSKVDAFPKNEPFLSVIENWKQDACSFFISSIKK